MVCHIQCLIKWESMFSRTGAALRAKAITRSDESIEGMVHERDAIPVCWCRLRHAIWVSIVRGHFMPDSTLQEFIGKSASYTRTGDLCSRFISQRHAAC